MARPLSLPKELAVTIWYPQGLKGMNSYLIPEITEEYMDER